MLFRGAAMTVFPAFAANVRHMFAVRTDRFAAFATDFGHMPVSYTPSDAADD
jgi:hypothetical protein